MKDPDHIKHHEGVRRNRIQIPKKPYTLTDLPVLDFSPSGMTSTAKGEGLKVCQKEGHDLIRREGRAGWPSHLKKGTYWLINCRRCGRLIGGKYTYD